MPENAQARRIILKFSQDDYILTWVEGFLIDRKAQNASRGTLDFYRDKLKLFTDYCEGQAITQITQITPSTIRQWLLYLEEGGHNPGGCHAAYRSLRAFLYWWEDEMEPENWRNPIRKVKGPRVGIEPLEPASEYQINALLGTCMKGEMLGDRDRAIILALLDTGARASEFLAIDLLDVDQITGEILIRRGKGKKPRSVFLGKISRKALRQYMKHRENKLSALWLTINGDRLSYGGLRGMIERRSKISGIDPPRLHDFRRAFALSMLRNGVDVYTIQKLMGHASLHVLRRYLALTNEDAQEGHRKGSPVDNYDRGGII